MYGQEFSFKKALGVSLLLHGSLFLALLCCGSDLKQSPFPPLEVSFISSQQLQKLMGKSAARNVKSAKMPAPPVQKAQQFAASQKKTEVTSSVPMPQERKKSPPKEQKQEKSFQKPLSQNEEKEKASLKKAPKKKETSLDDLLEEKDKPKDLDHILDKTFTSSSRAVQTGVAPEGGELSQMVGMIRHELMAHWNVPAEVQGLDIEVTVRIKLHEDGTLKSVNIIPEESSVKHALYHVVKESVLRTVHNPAWSPLKLPKKYYQTWETLTIHFNPKDVYRF